MNRDRTRRVLLVPWMVVIVLVISGMEAGPSPAACARGNLDVHRRNDTDVTLLDEAQCVVPTPWPDFVDFHWDDSGETPPSGAPSGAKVDVWVPSP